MFQIKYKNIPMRKLFKSIIESGFSKRKKLKIFVQMENKAPNRMLAPMIWILKIPKELPIHLFFLIINR